MGPDRSPVADLTVRLFGRVRILWHGREIDLPSRPAQALIAMLVLQPHPLRREAIAAEIWPEAGSRSASRLRQALWLVRRALARVGADPDAVLDIGQDTIGLRPGLETDVDVIRFEAFLRGHPPDIAAALRLRCGELSEHLELEGLSAWRDRVADLYEDVLATLAEVRLAAGDLDGARDAAVELLQRDPLREEAHAALIEIYGHRGSRSQVHRQYRRLRSILWRELGVRPLPDTDAIYRGALARTEGRAGHRAVAYETGGSSLQPISL